MVRMFLISFFSIFLLIMTSFGSVYAGDMSILSQMGFKRLDGLSSSQDVSRGTKGKVNLVDDYWDFFEHVVKFSHDGRLFAVFQQYDEDIAAIRIWDTQSGELKYRTVISDFADAAGGSYLNLDFSPDNQMLIVSGIIGYPLITWEFSKDNDAKLSCRGYMSGGVGDIAENNQSYTTLTEDSEFSLCRPGIEGELLNYKNWKPDEWWGDNLRTLHNDKILTIYNIRTQSTPAHQAKERPSKATLERTDLWNMNYVSEAALLQKRLDRKNQLLILLESFDDKVMISQWDYVSRKRLAQQIFDNVKADQFYFSDHHFLLSYGRQFTLFKRGDRQLTLLWQRDLSDIFRDIQHSTGDPLPSNTIEPYSISFSVDGREIIFSGSDFYIKKNKPISPVILISTEDGSVRQYPSLEKQGRIRIDAKAEYFFENHFDWCKEGAKTAIHSLKTMKKAGELQGGLMAMSPDGKVLAVCRDNEMSLWRK